MAEMLESRIIIGGSVAVLVAMLAGLIWYRRVRVRSIDARLESVAQGIIKDFLIPDDNAGEIHIEYALLTVRGIVVLNIKDVQGHVFGSDIMNDWTVIDGRQRFTFSNPQAAMFARVAAVSRIAPNVPVKGYIAFTSSALFSKGRPDHVIHIDQLLTELQRERESMPKVLDAFAPSWELLQQQAVITQVSGLVKV